MGYIKVKKKKSETSTEKLQKVRRTPWKKGMRQLTNLLTLDGQELPVDMARLAPQGRPRTEPNDDITTLLVACLRDGGFLKTACQLAGISKDTLDRWLKLGSETELQRCKTKRELKEIEPYVRVRLAVAWASAEAETRWISQVNDGAEYDWRAALAMLDRRFQKRWRKSTDVKVEGEIHHNHHIVQRILADPVASAKMIDAYEAGTETTDIEPANDSS